MRNAIGVAVLAVASIFLGWSWGSHKRTEQELNSYYYPALYAATVAVVDSETNTPIDFEIRWLEGELISPKAEEPTKVVDQADKSKSIALLRKWDRKDYSFEVSSPGYGSQIVTLEPIRKRVRRSVGDDTVRIKIDKSK